MYKQGKCDKKLQQRKRGRPIGQNRVPLSLEERRARNAQYERERRIEQADAMRELAEATGYQSTMSNFEILCAAIEQIRHATARDPTESLEHIQLCNSVLHYKILKLQNALGGMEQVDMSDSDSEEDYIDIEGFVSGSKLIPDEDLLASDSAEGTSTQSAGESASSPSRSEAETSSPLSYESFTDREFGVVQQIED